MRLIGTHLHEIDVSDSDMIHKEGKLTFKHDVTEVLLCKTDVYLMQVILQHILSV